MIISIGRSWLKAAVALIATYAIHSPSFATDASGMTNTMGCCSDPCWLADGKWSLELGSGAVFANVRDPSLDSYTIIPIRLTLSRSFDHVYLTNFAGGWLKGTAEATVDGYYDRVTSGTESYIAGFHFGPRYNFTKLGDRLVPFFELLVGAGWADAHQFYSNGNYHGLGQNFNFNFSAASGVRYDLTKTIFTRFALEYTHYSNGGLSEPQHSNKAIDALGPILSLGIHF